MSCRQVEERLSAYLEGHLNAKEALRVASHLQSCAACRRERDALREFEHEVRDLAIMQHVPSEFRGRCVDRWLAEHTVADSCRRLTWVTRAAVVGAVALVGLGVLRVRRPHPPTPSPNTGRGGAIERAGTFSPRPVLGEGSGVRAAAIPRSGLAFAKRVAAPITSEPGVQVDSARRSTLAPPRPLVPPGANDLAFLNRDPAEATRGWAPMRRDEWEQIETRVRRQVQVKDDFVRVSLPRVADATGTLFVAAVESYKREAAIVDSRLFRKIALATKGTALADLCDQLRHETGIALSAGQSVADEKITVFCKETPLRDVMRQLSRPFGYTWLRSGKTGEYKYELVQDLRSQLLEEELRDRDRREALLALDRDLERNRKYLDLSPDEALARSKTAVPAEKPLLEKLSGIGWGPIHMYFRLTRQEQEALRAGRELAFATRPEPGEVSLPVEVARGVIASYRGWRVHKGEEVWDFVPGEMARPEDPSIAVVPEVCTRVTLQMRQDELGLLALHGTGRIFFPKGAGSSSDRGPYGTGRSPVVLKPGNGALNARLSGDAVLRPPVSLRPEPSYRPASDIRPDDGRIPDPKVTTADVLEAVHRATGLPIISDYYTRLYPVSVGAVRGVPLFAALNQVADAMRLRWQKEERWLQFRSVSYYDDRLKEVPNRLLSRWSAVRRQKGSLSLDDVAEMVQLPDAQLDGEEMAEGAKALYGLLEWDLPRNRNLRPHLRYLASFTPEQRRQAMTLEGLPFARMSLAQQQQFIAQATLYEPIPLDQLGGATLRIDYSQPGWYQWGSPDLNRHVSQWAVVVEHGKQGRWAPRPSVRERTRDAAIQALLRIDPKTRDAVRYFRPEDMAPAPEPRSPVPLEAQIFPTRLSVVFLYFPSATNEQAIHIVHPNGNAWQLLR